MTERGILFSAPMVRALLAGAKTQTRRAVKPPGGRDRAAGVTGGDAGTDMRSPYGRPGDRLWVRESFFAFGRWGKHYNENKARDEWRFADMTRACGHAYRYAADGPDLPVTNGRSMTPAWHARPALFMPRAASRILLEIVAVRVEPLQTIDDRDATAEGIERIADKDGKGPVYRDYGMAGFRDPAGWFDSPVDSYRTLWERINGAGSWDVNPRVWVVEFRNIEL